MVKKHQKPTQTEPNGGIKDVEAPLDASNVKVIKAAEKPDKSADDSADQDAQ